MGGLDWAATLASGEHVDRPGLIERARGGAVILRMAERADSHVAAQLAQAVDHGDMALILLDDGIESDERPPVALTERCAFHCDLASLRVLDFSLERTGELGRVKPLLKSQRTVLAEASAMLGIGSARPLIFAERCARALAGLRGFMKAGDAELRDSAALVLAHRAERIPELAPQDNEPQDQKSSDSGEQSGEEESQEPPQDISLEDILLEAISSCIPPHLLDQIANGTKRSSTGQSGKSGQKQKSAQRGRPLGPLAGMPGSGKKLALLDTLRTAAPWQTIRRAEAIKKSDRLHIRTSDLRIRRFEEQRESLTIFAVDASGSSALARLAEAKGAVELMLAEAHVKRAQVALIAFRQSGAEILLPPTRSLTRARRTLSALPGGGGTPLAAGLLEALKLADASEKRGQSPTIALLTDGKGNVTLDGEADRAVAMEEASSVAKQIAATNHHAIVIDIAPRPREEAPVLASALAGRYVALPRANSAAMVSAIDSISEGAAA